LTGPGNRRAFSSALRDRLDDNDPDSMILALFDPDGLTAYNDAFGHAAGDALGQRLAGVPVGVLTANGAVHRIGGDEFCALLPGGDDRDALLGAATAVLSAHTDGFSICASLGSVRPPQETDDLEAAQRLADQRMYARKHRSQRSNAAQEVKHALLSALAHRNPDRFDDADDVAGLAALTALSLQCTPVGYRALKFPRGRRASEQRGMGDEGVQTAWEPSGERC
jgi:diguanylate cyclase (GGDEF)-like protein